MCCAQKFNVVLLPHLPLTPFLTSPSPPSSPPPHPLTHLPLTPFLTSPSPPSSPPPHPLPHLPLTPFLTSPSPPSSPPPHPLPHLPLTPFLTSPSPPSSPPPHPLPHLSLTPPPPPPTASIFAWTRGLSHRAKLDSKFSKYCTLNLKVNLLVIPFTLFHMLDFTLPICVEASMSRFSETSLGLISFEM